MKEPYNLWLFCRKWPATQGLWVFATLYHYHVSPARVTYEWVIGHVLSLQAILHKRALWLVALLRKMTCNLHISLYTYQVICVYSGMCNLHVIFRKRTTSLRALLWKMACKDKLSLQAILHKRASYLYRPFSTKEPYDSWLFCGKWRATYTYHYTHSTWYVYIVMCVWIVMCVFIGIYVYILMCVWTL